jgi:ADP-ribose pyrophosphatase YjhB (NUDIX family)
MKTVMETNDERRDSIQPLRRARVVPWLQRLRWLFKATLWQGITYLLCLAGSPLATVQVLCIDRRTHRLLVLRTREFATGYGPVEGLRHGSLSLGLIPLRGDVREDARRELAEEAVLDPPPLQDFWIAERYREGPHGQFDCTVLVVFCEEQQLGLRDETGDGAPCWLPLDEALALFSNGGLTELIGAWQDDPEVGAHADERRFLIGPADAADRSAEETALEQRLWSMPLAMLAEARALGPRKEPRVFQSSDDAARQLWENMSTASRDCFRPDPRLWRDCRLLTPASTGELLAGWWHADIESISGRAWEHNARSIAGRATARAILACQQRAGCEVSLDLIYDAREDSLACFVTCGAPRGVTSDVLLYAMMSPRFMVIPVLHSHLGHRSDRGFKQPSTADYGVMVTLHYRLEGAPVGGCVVNPDGSFTEYGLTGHGRCFYRRGGDALLPPGGEPLVCFTEMILPAPPRVDAPAR